MEKAPPPRSSFRAERLPSEECWRRRSGANTLASDSEEFAPQAPGFHLRRQRQPDAPYLRVRSVVDSIHRGLEGLNDADVYTAVGSAAIVVGSHAYGRAAIDIGRWRVEHQWASHQCCPLSLLERDPMRTRRSGRKRRVEVEVEAGIEHEVVPRDLQDADLMVAVEMDLPEVVLF